jgi:ankyrin repeat protein
MTLIAAAGSGQVELVQVLLRCGADARLREPDGTRALDWAAQEGHHEVVDLLLSHDHRLLDLAGLHERTPLMAAAGNGHVDLVGVLLMRGADARRRMERGARALDWAADEGHEGVVELLLTHDPQLLDLPGYGEATALMAAAANGHLALVQQLLAWRADPRLRDGEGTRALDWAAQNGRVAVIEQLLQHDPALLDLPGLGDRTALMAAAANNHLALVRLLLARGADPRLRKEEGTRALDWAAQEGFQEVVDLLLAHDPGLLDLPGYGDRTPLMAAAANAHVRLTLNLLDRGADPRLRKAEGTRALDWAAQNGHQAVVERLLSRDPDLLDLPGYGERTALIAAASNGHAELMLRLLERGAAAHARMSEGTRALDWAAQEGHATAVKRLLAHDPALLDLPGYGERTALVAAAGNGHIELVQLLLARGADPRARRSSGAHALDSAAQEGHLAVVDLLIAHDARLLDLPGAGERTALMAAASAGRLDVVQRLLSLGADPRLRESEGTQALDWAAQNGHRAVADALLTHDPGLLDFPGFGERTALLAAAWNGHEDVVRELLARGADTRRRRASGAHVLDGAAQDGHAEVVELLLRHDPGLLNLPGFGERTALMAAAINNRLEVVRVLLAHGADPTLRESEGTRALDWACQCGHQAVAEILLKHDPKLLDLPGFGDRTALVAAACNGHADLVAWLLKMGADPRKRECEGTRALDWAAQEGHTAVVGELLQSDPGLVDLEGFGQRSALIAAADSGHAEVVALLLTHGADTRRQRVGGARALDSAARNGHRDVVHLLLRKDHGLIDLPGHGGRTALIAAAGSGHAALTTDLLKQGADPRSTQHNGAYALEEAAEAGHGAVVAALLAHDPQLVELPGLHQRTALSAAAAAGHVEVVRELLAHGADPRRRRIDGANAAYAPARKGHVAVLETLLAHDPGLLDIPVVLGGPRTAELKRVLRADFQHDESRPPEGSRLIEVLIIARHAAIVQELLRRHGRLINLPGIEGATPLMLAAATAQGELTRWLLAHGANPFTRDTTGDHALLYALELQAAECARILSEHEPLLLHLGGRGGRVAASLIPTPRHGKSASARH